MTVQLILLDPNKSYKFPLEVARCPICGAGVTVDDFDEWETDDGRVTDGGFHINCETEPDIDSEEWEGWFNSHWSMPYMDWLPLETQLYAWFDLRYRIDLSIQRGLYGGLVPLPTEPT